MAKLTFIPQTGSGATPNLTLEDIPEEVREEVEQVYVALKTNTGRMRAEFDTIAEVKTYETLVKAYCALRPAGAIRYRKSPTKDLPKTAIDFRVTDITAGEAATPEIREAVEAVKESAKETATKRK